MSNFGARTWGFISSYIFVPLYLRFLGVEAYGLVGFYSTLVAVLVFADMGITATLNREMARLAARVDSLGDMRDTLRTYEVAYVCIALLLVLGTWLVAPLIAEHWLHSDLLQPRELTTTLRVMGMAIALQLPAGLYIGGLMGLQLQVRANAVQVAWGGLRGVGAVAVLWLVSPTVVAFALCQLCANAGYCVAARYSLWRSLSSARVPPPARVRWRVVRDTWRYSLGMVGMAAIAVLLTQTDKVVVSKVLPLEMLGYYTLAVSVAAVPLMLANPIATAVFPRLTGLVMSQDPDELARFYHRACELVAIATIPAGITLAFFAGDFIFAWTGSSIAAQRAGQVAGLLLVGQLMQAITVVPFNLALAYGNIRLNLQIGVGSLLLFAPLVIVLISRYGIVGAGVSWLVMNICTLPPYMYLLHNRFLPGELWHWCLGSVGRPSAAALVVVLCGRFLAPHSDSRLLTLSAIGIVMCVAVAGAAATVPEVRRVVLRNAGAFVARYGGGV